MKRTDPPIIVEEVIHKERSVVWDVITELNHMQNWFFKEIPAFQAVVGFETQFSLSSGDRTFPHVWKIIDVVEHEKISYNWSYEGYTGDSLVHFELFEKDGNTSVRLTTEIIEDFPQDIPEFKRESAVGGWTYFIKESLPKYVGLLR